MDRNELFLLAEAIRAFAAARGVTVTGKIGYLRSLAGRPAEISVPLGQGWSKDRQLVKFSKNLQSVFGKPNLNVVACGMCNGDL